MSFILTVHVDGAVVHSSVEFMRWCRCTRWITEVRSWLLRRLSTWSSKAAIVQSSTLTNTSSAFETVSTLHCRPPTLAHPWSQGGLAPQTSY